MTARPGPGTQSFDDGARRALVEAIHATDTRLVLAVAGGGNAVITDLLDVPGASRTVLEVVVPYAPAALAELTGADPAGGGASEGAVSRATAGAMARACLVRARSLAGPGERVIGVACTAALASDRPKKGEHRAHLAMVRRGAAQHDAFEHRVVCLEKGALDRAGEDRVVADALLELIAAGCGLGGRARSR